MLFINVLSITSSSDLFFFLIPLKASNKKEPVSLYYHLLRSHATVGTRSLKTVSLYNVVLPHAAIPDIQRTVYVQQKGTPLLTREHPNCVSILTPAVARDIILHSMSGKHRTFHAQ